MVNDKGVTQYDKILTEVQNTKVAKEMPGVNEHTLLFVIDVQNDFVTGSFKMPCNQKMLDLVDGLTNIMQSVSTAGGDIIASMDYHQPDDCSFNGARDGEFQKVDTNGDRTDTMRCSGNKVFLRAQDEDERYHNMFPPHTLIREDETWAYPTYGAELQSDIMANMKAVRTAAEANGDPGSVELVFKGFHRSTESFSAFPHF